MKVGRKVVVEFYEDEFEMLEEVMKFYLNHGGVASNVMSFVDSFIKEVCLEVDKIDGDCKVS